MDFKQVSFYWWARTGSGNHAVAEKKPNACAPWTSRQARVSPLILTNPAEQGPCSLVGFTSTTWGITPTAIPLIENRNDRRAAGTQ
jgi:hypothetical protein